MTDKEKKVIVLILGPIVIGIIYLSFKLRNDERDYILQTGIEVVGTVSNVGWKTIDVSYSINGKLYTYTENIPFKGVVSGEQFYTVVNRNNYDRALVYDNKPILDSIKYSFSTVRPQKVSEPIIDDDYLIFEYTVNGKIYSRTQKYYGDVPIPRKIQNLIVKYRIDRPEIGYLVEVKQ
ncbi:MAG: hypothetical protein EAY81_10645 [Bacteroidetes bacterium]|nr:MAG: hypothetical protein EAY81_10645 [Bacteroidota bacterium]